jgi:hypothetical protein
VEGRCASQEGQLCRLDAATVDKLFREAVPLWNEFAYAVAERREAYLRNKLLAGE